MKEMKIGKTERLTVLRRTEYGLYLGKPDGKESVLLPNNQAPAGAVPGNELTVFIYRDSEDRPVATVRKPFAEVGQFAYLQVKSVTRIGAFLDWGLEKDLFLPYKEMEEPVKAGDTVMVYLYLDKSDRIAATTRIYDRLSGAEKDGFRPEDEFSGAVYRVNRSYGVFVAVCPKREALSAGQSFSTLYFGLVPVSQVFAKFKLGESVHGRIVRIRADGKLDLALRKRDYEQLSADGEVIMEKIREYGGILPFSENASPELIRRELAMSKSAFKKAVGHLYKERKVEIGETEIRLCP